MDEFERHRHSLLARRRRLRRLLRPLPRRANIQRYPVLRWFARYAAKAPFLWSFKRSNVMPSLYAGAILALLPLYGFQFVLAFMLALLVRGNLTVMVALQFITNPFTIVPIYGFTGFVGLNLMDAFGTGEDMGRVMRGATALMIGGIATGFATALLADIGWRFAAWEAGIFRRRWSALREARAKDGNGEPTPRPDPPAAS